ncbi:MAG: hypothetical protein Q8Q09_13620 [Deltaproteobacteria bacterium]|nr:hypothetical protein [Deltaproteobacteria bacterium]
MAHTTRFALESTRIRAIHPAVCAVNGRWFAAWLREDLGRVSIEVATLHKGRVERRRVAEVWTSLDPVELALAAPQIASRPNGGVWLAWRESRGNLPAIYLRALDPLGRHDGPEHRLSTRGVAAANTRFALASNHRGGWACLFAEPRENLQTVCLAWG